ncbi:MAG TPA: FAD-dependent oxidoreductase [Gemmatimonadales bacterium]
MTDERADDRVDDVFNPRLADDEIAVLEPLGTRVRLQDGEPLFRTGVRRGGFFVVLSGAVEILDRSGDVPRTVAMHRSGQFTGDIDILARRAPLVTAVARGETEVLRISSSDIHRLIGARPAIGDTLLRAFIARREQQLASGLGGIRVIGSPRSRDAFRIRELLSRNQVPFTWVDVDEDPGVAELVRTLGLEPADLPAVAIGAQPLLRHPSLPELAEVVGLRHPPRADSYDLLIVGSGPAGLAAAVYGASEGLGILVLDSVAPGGQAGASTKIENYLGFPTGITGAELTGRATVQAQKFGAELCSATTVTALELDGPTPVIRLDDGGQVAGRCVLVATGADYRRLDVPGRERFDGVGVYYAATPMELTSCRGQDVVVVGGGNSAGQAVMFLAQHTRRVWLLLRGGDLYRRMSSYLADRVEAAENVEVLHHTEIRRMLGDERLEGVEVEHTPTGATRRIDASGVFSFIGAAPRTAWLPSRIQSDERGFVLTGRDLASSGAGAPARAPATLETSHPGVFAAGDVRHGSVKRVASAVGEGAMVIMFVHQHLAEH